MHRYFSLDPPSIVIMRVYCSLKNVETPHPLPGDPLPGDPLPGPCCPCPTVGMLC